MNIDLDHVAKLARLKLTPDEKALFSQQMPRILDYIATLQEVDTSGIDPKAYLTEATNVFRPDVPSTDMSTRNAAVAAFPKSQGDALEVPGVFSN